MPGRPYSRALASLVKLMPRPRAIIVVSSSYVAATAAIVGGLPSRASIAIQ